MNKTINSLDRKFWRIVFLLAGLFTSLGVIPGIIRPKDGLMTFVGKEINDFYAIYFFQSLWIIVLIFGIGYLIVATRPSKHIGIVIMGLIGKFTFAINVLLNLGNLSQLALIGAIIDFAFVILFGLFIFFYKTQSGKE